MTFQMMTLAFSAAAIPVLGQITPESAIGKLAVGSAQAVLAFVCVVLTGCLIAGFRLYRRDMKTANDVHRKDMLQSQDQLREIIADSNTDREKQIAATNDLTTELKELTTEMRKK